MNEIYNDSFLLRMSLKFAGKYCLLLAYSPLPSPKNGRLVIAH